jgi:hypothetical protein
MAQVTEFDAAIFQPLELLISNPGCLPPIQVLIPLSLSLSKSEQDQAELVEASICSGNFLFGFALKIDFHPQ